MPQVYRRDAQERMRNSERQLETLADVASSTVHLWRKDRTEESICRLSRAETKASW